MPDIRIATTTIAGLRRLGVHGQSVVSMHRQLSAILGNRLGRQHAQLLARPEIDPNGDRIDWYAPSLGAVRQLSELSEADRQPIETLRRQLIAEIGQLAQKMQREGESAELVAHMLELAVLTPPDAAVYAIGPQPALVLWGHATEEQVTPEPPTRAPPAAAAAAASAAISPPVAPQSPAAQAAPPATPATAAAADTARVEQATAAALAAPADRRSWLAWLLPLLLLLLLAYLVWQALQPLPPVVVERPAPPALPAADPVAPEQEKETALRAELARLSQERDKRLALCKPVPPPAPPPDPPKVTELTPPKTEELPSPPSPKPEVKPTPPPKAETKPKPEPAPKAEAKPKPAPPPKAEAKPKPEPPKAEPKPKAPPKAEQPEVALAPPAPPPPPKSPCKLDVRPGDEPEVIVVVDASGSMNESIPGASSRMSAAKGAIEQVVTGLPPEVEVGLIDFTDCGQVRVDDFYAYPRRSALIGQVRGLQPERRTALGRSLERAGSRASSSAQSTIVVVTDGEDTCGSDPCAAAAAIKRRKPNVTINVIDVSGGSSPTAQCVARNGGGKVLTPNSAMDMKNKVQQATRLPDTRNCR